MAEPNKAATDTAAKENAAKDAAKTGAGATSTATTAGTNAGNQTGTANSGKTVTDPAKVPPTESGKPKDATEEPAAAKSPTPDERDRSYQAEVDARDAKMVSMLSQGIGGAIAQALGAGSGVAPAEDDRPLGLKEAKIRGGIFLLEEGSEPVNGWGDPIDENGNILSDAVRRV